MNGILSLAGIAVALAVGAVTGCASTKVETSGTAARQLLCAAHGERLTALALWGPIWRPDQKEVPLREAAAQRGLEQFFARSGCFSNVEIGRLAGGRSAIVPSDEEVVALAASSRPVPDRVVVITVRELGPIIRLLGSPALVEGGTEVVLEVKVLDVRTGRSMANQRTHWQNGGAFVIKGVASLEQDMGSALEAALAPAASPR